MTPHLVMATAKSFGHLGRHEDPLRPSSQADMRGLRNRLFDTASSGKADSRIMVVPILQEAEMETRTN
jgi:hypothetical protein